MASAMYDNKNIEFVVTRPMRFKGKQYKIGDDLPKKELNLVNPEVLIRTRHITPVVEDTKFKPKFFHREVKPRSVVFDRLGLEDKKSSKKSSKQEEDPQQDANEVGDLKKKSERESDDTFTVADHTAAEVLDFVDAHPDLIDDVIKAEKKGKARVTLLDSLDKAKAKEDDDE